MDQKKTIQIDKSRSETPNPPSRNRLILALVLDLVFINGPLAWMVQYIIPGPLGIFLVFLFFMILEFVLFLKWVTPGLLCLNVRRVPQIDLVTGMEFNRLNVVKK